MVTQFDVGQWRLKFATALGRIPFPIPGIVLTLAAIAVLSVAFGATSLLSSQPSYVRYGVPVFLCLPFLIAHIFDRRGFAAQSLSLVLSVLATFLGASLAFIQSDIQSLQEDKATFSRMLDRVMYQMSAINEGHDAVRIDKVSDRVGYNEYYLTSLLAVITSDKASQFLTLKQTYELDLSYRALLAYVHDADDAAKPIDQRRQNLVYFFTVVHGTYANSCALREAINGNFDYSSLDAVTNPAGFISFLPLPEKVLAVLPRVCRTVPTMQEVYKRRR